MVESCSKFPLLSLVWLVSYYKTWPISTMEERSIHGLWTLRLDHLQNTTLAQLLLKCQMLKSCPVLLLNYKRNAWFIWMIDLFHQKFDWMLQLDMFLETFLNVCLLMYSNIVNQNPLPKPLHLIVFFCWNIAFDFELCWFVRL